MRTLFNTPACVPKPAHVTFVFSTPACSGTGWHGHGSYFLALPRAAFGCAAFDCVALGCDGLALSVAWNSSSAFCIRSWRWRSSLQSVHDEAHNVGNASRNNVTHQHCVRGSGLRAAAFSLVHLFFSGAVTEQQQQQQLGRRCSMVSPTTLPCEKQQQLCKHMSSNGG